MIGKGRCPIVDTWWQTETGAIMIAPLPGATPLKPGSGTFPLPGILAEIVDLKGQPVEVNQEGYLMIRHPWPSMFRTLWSDPERYEENYWSRRFRAFISPGMRRGAMKTAISGCWAAWTM